MPYVPQMLHGRIASALVLAASLLLVSCGGSSNGPKASQSTPAASVPAAASSSLGSSGNDDYQKALGSRACYVNSIDAAEDPLGRDVPCEQKDAGFRLVGIQPAVAGDCPPNQVLVSEKQASANSVAATLCLEPVTH